MTSGRARVACLITVAVWIAFMIVGTFVAHAAVQPTEQHEALLIRPQRPIREQEQVVPCLRKAEAHSPVTWELRDKDGNVLMAGSQVVRKRC